MSDDLRGGKSATYQGISAKAAISDYFLEELWKSDTIASWAPRTHGAIDPAATETLDLRVHILVLTLCDGEHVDGRDRARQVRAHGYVYAGIQELAHRLYARAQHGRKDQARARWSC